MYNKDFFNELFSSFKGSWSLVCQRSFRFSRTLLTGILLIVFFFPANASSQCAMCRAVLTSEENVSMAEGVNNGIVYLMSIPYILVGVLFYFVYRKMKA